MPYKELFKTLVNLDLGDNHDDFSAAIGEQFDDIETDIDTLFDEIFPQTASVEFIAKFEKDWDVIPNTGDTLQIRRDNVITKMRLTGDLSILHYVDIAASQDIIISIDQSLGFILGVSILGTDVFGGKKQRYLWQVTLSEQHRFPFILGTTTLGSPFVTFDKNNSVEAILEQYKPAHTKIQFDYFNWGFEEGNLNAWRERSAVIDSGTVRTGSFSAKLDAIGADINGVESTPFQIPTGKGFTIDSWHNVTAHAAGTYLFEVVFYSDLMGKVLISASTIFTKAATTAGFEQGTKTIGFARQSPDFIYPSTAKSFRIRQKWETTPTGTAYIDDVDLSYL